MPQPSPASGRRLLVDAAAEDRLAATRAFLDGYPSAVVLAPTRLAADDLLRRLAVERGQGFWELRRSTVQQLANELALPALARQGRAPLWTLSQEALTARALAGCHGRLKAFAQAAGTPGMARALARTLRELRLAGVTPEALRTLGDTGHDLALLLETLLGLLADGGLADEAEVYALAKAACSAEGIHPYLGRPLLLLDLSPRSRAERALLTALAARAPAVLATALEGDAEGLAALTLALGVEAAPVGEAEHDASRLGRLRRRIFAGEEAASVPIETPAWDLSFDLFSAPGEGREAVEIARRILRLTDEGIPFDGVAIALRDPDLYFPLLEEALGRAGIPCYFSQGTRRPDPAGRAFLALLACADERLAASRFAEYLSLGQVPPLDAHGAPPPRELPWVEARGEQLVLTTLEPLALAPIPEGRPRSPWRWERLLVDAAVIEGADRWRRRLDGVDAELRLQLRDLEDGDERRRASLEEQLLDLDGLRRFALPLIDDLAALPAQATWGVWLERLDALAQRALGDPERVRATLEELRPLAEVGAVGLLEVRRVLEERLTLLRTPPRERPYGRVQVATFEELRGRAFDAVFVPGLAEGLFPRRALEDPLLLDAERARLDASLPRRDERVARERLLLRLAIGAARARLIASYPNLDPLGERARVPSFYALDLLRAADGVLPDVQALEQRAASASASLLGWPAPREPEAAVDDTEFDLALLAEIQRRPAAESRGAARYLLETNERLKCSLRNRYSRFTAHKLQRSDGLLPAADNAAGRSALAAHRLAARPYSPTALQHYAACPLRFAYHAILGLRPRDRLDRLEQLDPPTRGALFHEAQFEIQQDLLAAGLLPVTPETLPTAARRADACLDRVAARYGEELAPAIPRVYASEIEALRLDLRAWLRKTAEARDGFVPHRFELAFGLPRDERHDPSSVAEPVAIEVEREGGERLRAALRGSIDLLEREPESGLLRVTDHKTGRSPDRRSVVVGGGELLQPLLYSLVAEKLLGQPVDSGRLFYCTRRAGQRVIEVPLEDASRMAIGDVLHTIDQAVTDGNLPAMPRKDACGHCDYRPICGPLEERRIQIKSRERLAGLDALRRRR